MASDAFSSPTFDRDGSFQLDEPVGAATISPSGRDVALASREGLHIIDLDNPYSVPYVLRYPTENDVVDVHWSPFSSRESWLVSTSGPTALVWDVNHSSASRPHITFLRAHERAITDINFAANHPDLLATCAVDSFIFLWDMRQPERHTAKLGDWFASASQVKWNRQDANLLASSHDTRLHIWDVRMCAAPLRTIDAHATKIYGVDWNPHYRDNILTCSLDRTIKFWNWARVGDPKGDSVGDPIDRIIRTPFPVGRARHTPFGFGILALPKRENNDLHLYDRRTYKLSDRDGYIPAKKTFEGHKGPVKEFLWRYRGGIENGRDLRDFQLVSWGTDKKLCLHKLNAEALATVGYERGHDLTGNIIFTRKDATYKTFRKEYDDMVQDSAVALAHPFERLDSIKAWRESGISPSVATHGTESSGKSFSKKATKSKKVPQAQESLSWMKRVKLGRSDEEANQDRAGDQTALLVVTKWFGKGSLGEELKHVEEKFENIDFEQINVSQRELRVRVEGPWAEEGSEVTLSVHFSFPDEYPMSLPPKVFIDPALSGSLPLHTRDWLIASISEIASLHVQLGKGSIEAALGFVRGQYSLNEIIPRTARGSNDKSIASEEVSQSILNLQGHIIGSRLDDEDEDDAVIGTFTKADSVDDLENSTADLGEKQTRSVNVPLPRTAGAVWCPAGQLVCFFPAGSNKQNIGKPADAPDFRGLAISLGTIQGHESAFEKKNPYSPSFFSRQSTDSSPERSFDSEVMPFPMSPSFTWRNGAPHKNAFWKTQEDWMPHVQPQRDMDRASDILAKSSISICTLEQLLPVNKELAMRYKMTGSSHAVCQQNGKVCAQYSEHTKNDYYHRIEQLWQSAALICTSRVIQWGRHPAGHASVKQILNELESHHDIQHLALMSYIFATKQSQREEAPNSAQTAKQTIRPMPGIKFKNQDGFDPVKSPVPLLSPKDAHKRRYWRSAYAEHLFAWQLHQQRCALLKMNSAEGEMAGKVGEKIVDNIPEEEYCVGLKLSPENRLPVCAFCGMLVRGFAALCVKCGHVMHGPCQDTWKAASFRVGGGMMCPMEGCGCDCRKD